MTELVWEGKYKDGKRVAPVRIPLPFQTVETVNESAQVRAHQYDLWSQGRPTAWRNRLIWGDKKYVLPSLLPEFAGKVNLIYIDPPFATGADFSFTTTIPDSDESFTKEPSMIETKAYRDTWGHGLDSYLQWFYETAAMLHDLLADDGSLYVHLDSNISHFAKIILDELFGIESYRNEVIWKRTSAHGNVSQRYGAIHDAMLFYSLNDSFTWNQQYAPYDEEYIETFFDQVDQDGRRYARRDLTAAMERASKGQIYTWKGITPPPSRCWAMTKDKMDELDAQGRIHWPKKAGGMPRLKLYPEDLPGTPVQDIWTDISQMHNLARERTGYPTQKPEALLERIIKASSNEGDLILDCFCGSGTTAAVAEKLRRRWITADLGRFAIHTARKRLLSIPNVTPFVVQNLGKYERQAWQTAEFAEGDPTQNPNAQLAYRRFMLALYRAQPLDGYTWLHGLRDGRLVHIGSVDAPVAVGDIQNIVKEFWKARSSSSISPSPRREKGPGDEDPRGPGDEDPTNGVDVLGWDFAFELNEVAREMAAEANIHLKFKRVPREVLEKKAVEQGDIKFFELAALSARISQKDREGLSGQEQPRGPHVTVTLSDFVVPPDDIPEDIQRAVTHWSQWIDYWAVDWDYKDDTFHNMAQTYRTRKDPQLQPSLAHTYDHPGDYTIVVKVIDILGNDTTKTLKVEVLTP